MTTAFSKWPNGLVICLSTLLCSAVVALQNAPSYAGRLETTLNEFSTDAAEVLRSAGNISLAVGLNSVEQKSLTAISQWVAPEDAVTEPEPETDVPTSVAQEQKAPARETPPPPPAAPKDVVQVQPDHVVRNPEKVVIPPPTPTAPLPPKPAPTVASPIPALPALPALPVAVEDDEMAEEVDAQDEEPTAVVSAATPKPSAPISAPEPPAVASAPEPVRETMAAATSRWWWVLSDPTGEGYSAYAAKPRFQIGVPTASVINRKWSRPVQAEEAAPTKPEPQIAQAAAEPQPTPLPAVTASAPEPLTQAPPMRYHIMMVGDSLMEDLGPRTHRAFMKRKGVDFVICAKFSTGLCRPDYFDWPAHLRAQVAKQKPDLVVFFMGANDGMPIREKGKVVSLGGDTWREAYMRKMDEVVSIVREVGAEVIWVELPAVGGRYNRALFENQRAQREYCQRAGLLSLQTDPLFSGVWGKFEAFGEYHGKQVRLRRKDLTHLTPDGNMKLLENLKPMMEERMIAFYRAHPERHLDEAQVARIKSVPAIYTCKYTPPKKKPQPRPAAQPVPQPLVEPQ